MAVKWINGGCPQWIKLFWCSQVRYNFVIMMIMFFTVSPLLKYFILESKLALHCLFNMLLHLCNLLRFLMLVQMTVDLGSKFWKSFNNNNNFKTRTLARLVGETGIFESLISSVLFLHSSVTVSRTIGGNTKQLTFWKAPQCWHREARAWFSF